MNTRRFDTSPYDSPPITDEVEPAVMLRDDQGDDANQDGFFQRRWPIFRPLLGLVLMSLVIRWADLDLRVAALFYDRSQQIWPYELAQPWLTIYRQGTLPSFVLAIAGIIVALLGPWILPRPEWRQSSDVRRAGLFLFLMLAIGPGLIVNVGFKDLWGRPRPLQCSVFSGEKEFLPVGTWATEPSRNSSFPSGHAAVAFYLIAPAFIVGRNRPGWKAAWLTGGFLYGCGMGLTRVIQGGHFISDVVWAGGMVYFTGVVLAWILLRSDGRCAIVNSADLA